MSKIKKKQAIIITGMHRSGTSLVGGIFEILGYNFGKTLMPATADNPKGYFENLLVWQLNEKILSHGQVKWDSTEELNTDNTYFQNRVHQQEIFKIVAEDYLSSNSIVLKDPRFCITLPLWLEALEHVGYNISIIACVRNPQEVIQSLYKRDDFSYEKSALLYSKYYTDLFINNFERRILTVNFNDVLKDPLGTFEQMESTSNLNFPLKLHDNLDGLNNFLDSDLYRNRKIAVLNYLIPPIASITYQLLGGNSNKEEWCSLKNDLKESLMMKSFKDEQFKKYSELVDDNDSQIELIEQSLKFTLVQNENYKDDIDQKDQLIQTLVNNTEERNQMLSEFKKTSGSIDSLRDEVEVIQKLINDSSEVVRSKISNDLFEHINSLHKVVTENRKMLEFQKERELDVLKEDIIGLEQELDIQKNTTVQIQQLLKNSEETNTVVRSKLVYTEGKLREQHKEYVNLKSSFSSRIGFSLTWPLRKIIDIIFLLSRFKTVIPVLLAQVFKNPRIAIKIFSIDRLYQLKRAVEVEEPELVRVNLRKSIKDRIAIEEVKESKNDSFPIICHCDEALIKEKSLFIRGWAISETSIIDIKLIAPYGAEYKVLQGFDRNDLSEAYPNHPNSKSGGFFLFQELLEPIHTGTIRITDESGVHVDLNIKFDRTDSFKYVANNMDMSYLDTEIQYPIWRIIKSEGKLYFKNFNYTPLISIILPVYDIDPKWLNECIQSVVDQIYENWELCIYDDASTKEETIQCLKSWESKDRRIKIKYGNENLHISGASNKAAELCKGEYYGLLDHDDLLHPHALYEVINLLNNRNDVDVIYTDEDKITMDGEHLEPHFKPDWSQETLENMMYIGHFLVIKSSIFKNVKGFRIGYEGSQDYDLILRISKIVKHIHHIPKVLYHWRIVESSVAGGIGVKNYAYDAAIRALKDHFKGTNQRIEITKSPFQGLYKVRRRISKSSGLVQIIIPFKDSSEMTLNCLKSLEECTYDNYKVLLVSNNSKENEFDKVSQYVSEFGHIDLVKFQEPFNYSRINNWAVERTVSDYILFLNNDILLISDDFIERMMEFAQLKTTGVVGAKLLYDDNTIQHAGVIMKIGGVAGHAFRFLPDEDPGYCGYASVVRNCSAVTGACMMIRRELFLELGGFDNNLAVAYNDIDLCLKALRTGYRNIYTPHAKLYHLESKTRPKTVLEMTQEELDQFNEESSYMKKAYEEIFINGDPFYNVNLTLKRENYALNI